MSDERVEAGHPVTFAVDYPGRPLNRLATAFRIFTATDAYPPFRLAPCWRRSSKPTS